MVTKAETLLELRKKLKSAEILPLEVFYAEQWKTSPEKVEADVLAHGWKNMIVRSSAANEDSAEESLAGKYTSVPNTYPHTLKDSIAEVIDSYGDLNEGDMVFVQPMLEDVIQCGVAFTLDPNNGGNYYVLNYDESGSTSSITGGDAKSSKLYYCFKGAEPNEHKQTIDCLRELETYYTYPLDVEFAVTRKGLIILQVRKLCIKVEQMDISLQSAKLELISKKIVEKNKPYPFLYGKRSIFGIMPDWNPAEIIGVYPRTLAFSLYKEIITDNIWAYQRNNYGYKNLRSHPLIIDLCGLPYVDVRVSFNSFLPEGLDSELSEKLINYYLDRLLKEPHLHDKVEFEIVFSCYTLDLPERISVLSKNGFSEHEIETIKTVLKCVTNNIIDNENGLWRQDHQKVLKLDARRQHLLTNSTDKVTQIYWMLEDCKRYGTLPFAGLARAAFIAMQILDSLVKKNILSEAQKAEFLNDMNTVSKRMTNDFAKMSKVQFIEKYGHLRPGTYDITCPRYDETSERYFDWNSVNEPLEVPVSFKLTLEQMRNLKRELKANGLNDDVLALFDFMKGAIEGREYSKFLFARNLSEAIKIFSMLGEEHGFSIEDMSFADINVIRKLYASSVDIKETLAKSIEEGKSKHNVCLSLVLPPLIIDSQDCYEFYFMDSQPNFITKQSVVAEVISDYTENISGKILLIPSADPGFDWIFSHNISGFITKYGGANSHMAIRAFELGIPAVVGIGEKEYDRIVIAKTVEINCETRKVSVLC